MVVKSAWLGHGEGVEDEMIPHKYGIELAQQLSDLELELYCFRIGWGVEDGGLGKAGHFKEAAQLLWGKPPKQFKWHPWAEWMLEESCANQYLGIAGAGSVGKTDFAAIWAIVNWLADPVNTMVLVTSTSLKESRKRIWGSIREYYMSVKGLPGKLVDSVGMIVNSEYQLGEYGTSDKSGIALIAGEKKKEKEAIGKLIGMKNKKVILIADELPELSESILHAAYTNLCLNPSFQLIGLGNFNSMYDAFGQFVKPRIGYDKLTQDMDEWETERGKCIRLDGLKSPNVLAGKDVWPIYGMKDLAEHKKLGEFSPGFWRMCRSFPCPSGEEFTIYSEADFISGHVHDQPVWVGSYTNIAALDPGFTNGGDRSVAFHARYGMTSNGKMTLAFVGYKELTEDVRLKDQARSFQIAIQYMNFCIENHVSPQNAAVDATGAGIPFSDIVGEVWSNRFLRVAFGGRPSEYPVGTEDPRPALNVYTDRVSEIWYSGVEFVRGDQVRGLDLETAKELKSRRYETVKRDGVAKIRVESKTDMKKRTGKSPDIADAACMCVAIVRERLGGTADLPVQSRGNDVWVKEAVKASDIFEDEQAESFTRDQIWNRTEAIWD